LVLPFLGGRAWAIPQGHARGFESKDLRSLCR